MGLTSRENNKTVGILRRDEEHESKGVEKRKLINCSSAARFGRPNRG